MPKCTKVYTRLTLETCYDKNEIVTASVIVNRYDLSVEEICEHVRGVLLASGYSQDSVDTFILHD